jgi:hypothetical protein
MELFGKSLTVTDFFLFLFNILFIQAMLMLADLTINYAWGITFGFTHIPLFIINGFSGRQMIWSDILPIADLHTPICAYAALPVSQRPATLAESCCDWVYAPWQVCVCVVFSAPVCILTLLRVIARRGLK